MSLKNRNAKHPNQKKESFWRNIRWRLEIRSGRSESFDAGQAVVEAQTQTLN